MYVWFPSNDLQDADCSFFSKKLTVAGCDAESKLDWKVNFIAPLYQKPNCSKTCCRQQVELKSLFYVIKPAPMLLVLALAFLTGVHQYYFCHPCQFSPIMSVLYHSAEMLTCHVTLPLITAQCITQKWMLHSNMVNLFWCSGDCASW